MPDLPVEENPFDFAIEYSAYFIFDQYRISDKAADAIDEIYPEVIKGKKSTIKKLHRLCKKYPNIPHFKNYLSIAYDSAGNYKKAVQVNRELLHQHPDYLFAKINQAEDLIANNRLDEVPELLGEEMHIHKLYPDRDIFHIDEVLKYYGTTIQYLLKADRADDAKLRFEFIIDVEPDSPEVERSMFDIMQHTMKKSLDLHQQEKLMERTVESRSYPEDLQTDQAPLFTHSEIEEIYKHGLDIPEELIKSILDLPRETLIPDLERVLQDAINRYEFFYDEASDEIDGWDEKRYEFSVHAILLLTELRSKESLDKILDLLRQGKEFREFWFGDLLEDLFSEPVAILGEENLKAVTDFVKEPDLDAYNRQIGVSALENLVRLDESRREEVIEHLDDLIQFHLGQLDNDRVIDTTLLSFLVWSCINISAEELLPSIRELFEHNLIYKTMVGDLKTVEHDIKGEMVVGSDQPRTIYEMYETLTTEPFMGAFSSPEEMPENGSGLNPFSDFSEGDFPYAAQPFLPGTEPATNPYKDVGRNDPCPCGSGKKYKKCCL
jgi:tetratricopeptide (TPR) repeat protein